jgi:molybdate transport system substrate-binding protein
MSSIHRVRTRLLLALVSSLFVASAVGQEEQKPALLVFAAASLTNVLDELGQEYERTTGQKVKLSFAASSVLARQIEAGGSADAFISADQEWMDYLAARALINKATRTNLVSNRLVLIAPADSKLELEIAPNFELAKALGRGRLATGDPDTVPVGRYARTALTSLGVWNDVADRLVRAENVRSAMLFVARGEVPLGIVYTTDALVDRHVRVVATFPENTHLPITYPAAATASAKPGADRFIQFLASAPAQVTWRRFGFGGLKP